MCVNCKVFDQIQLPEGFEKKYLDWYVPCDNESLENYTRNMAKDIDSSQPFIIVGYSLGGIIMQEMNKFLTPEKNILLSSIKTEEEIPRLFQLAKKIRFANRFPKKLYVINKTISNLFTHLVYKMSIEEMNRCVVYTCPTYMKWTTLQITNWTPTVACKNLYHIHGTKDQVFPYKKIKDVYTIKNGDHLMVMKKAEEVNKVLNEILVSV